MISMLLAAMVLGAGHAGGAHARVLGYEGTLTLDFIQPDLPTLAFTGGGWWWHVEKGPLRRVQ